MIKTTLLLFAATLAAGAQSVPLPCESSMQQISPTGEQALVRCQDRSLRLINLPSGKEARPIASGAVAARARRYSGSQFSTDGKFVAIGYSDGTVQVFATTTQEPPVTLQVSESIDEIHFLPGNQVLVLSPHMRPGEVWDVSGRPQQIATLATDFDGLNVVAVSNNGKFVATVGADTIVRLWDTASWKMVHEYRGDLLEAFAAAFTPDDRWLLLGGAAKQITIVDVATGTEIRKLPVQRDPIDALASLDASHVAARYMDEDGRKPPYVMIWDLPSGSAKPVAEGKKMTGGGVVKGKLWLANADGKTMEIWNGE